MIPIDDSKTTTNSKKVMLDLTQQNINQTTSTSWNMNTTTASTSKLMEACTPVSASQRLIIRTQSDSVTSINSKSSKSARSLFHLNDGDQKISKQDKGMVLADSDITERQLDIVKKEIETTQFKSSDLNMQYSRIVLGAILLCQISNQWQRAFIACVYNFTYEGAQTNPHYNIQAAIPNFSEFKYSLLAGPAFMFLFGTLSLFSGMLSDVYNRRNLLTISCVIWSACTFFSGYCDEFWQLLLLRIGLSVFEANCAPNCYGLIVDYFPPEQRTSANAIYALGIYLGAGLTNFAIVLIDQYGWRDSYFIVGGIGMVSGLIALAIIREPVRDRFLAVKKEEKPAADVALVAHNVEVANVNDSSQTPTAKINLNLKHSYSPGEYSTGENSDNSRTDSENLSYLSATHNDAEASFQIDVRHDEVDRKSVSDAEKAMLSEAILSSSETASKPKKKESGLAFYWRGFKNILGNDASRWAFIAGCARFWQQQIVVYFSLTYFAFFDKEDMFGVVNGWAIIIGGSFSNMAAGRIADKYEPKSFKTKPMLCIVMSLLCVPCLMGAFLTSFNFWFCMFWLSLENFLCEGYTPVNIAIIQTVVDPEFKGMAVGLFRCLQTYAFAIGFVVVGKLTTIFTGMQQTGYVIGLSVIIPSIVAAYGYYRCMGFYVGEKVKQQKEKNAAISMTDAYIPPAQKIEDVIATNTNKTAMRNHANNSGKSTPSHSLDELTFQKLYGPSSSDQANDGMPTVEFNDLINATLYNSSRSSNSVLLSKDHGSMTSQDLYSFQDQHISQVDQI